MGLHSLLKRTKEASPLVPALAYTGVLTLANLAIGFAPKNPFVVLIGFLGWVAAAILLFIVVTWYRDDDWLAAGFLLGVTLLLGGMVADIIGKTVLTHSVADAMFEAAGAPLRVSVRALIAVPLCGGVIALARWLTRLFRRERSDAARPIR